jgi:galactose mutarotase-like enzyme
MEGSSQGAHRVTRVSTLQTLGADHRAVSLENGHLRIVVLPEVGGMIHQFVHKASGRDLLYHHPRLAARPAYYRAPVDDWWAGGVIEGLPTGFACTVDGEQLPDFGELWSEPWVIDALSDDSVTLSCRTRVSPLQVTRVMSLGDDDRALRTRHRIDNLSDIPIDILWGIHPTLPVGPRTMIQVPARTEYLMRDVAGAVPNQGQPSPFLRGPNAFSDLATQGQRFSYLTDLPESAWFAVWDDEWHVGLGMTFNAKDLPCAWMWLIDGWRGLRAVTIEPWTGWPGSLAEAIRVGRSRTLGAGGSMETDTTMTAFEPVGPLRGFDSESRPITA